MKPDIDAIGDERVRFFYSMYWPQRQILYDFFAHLTDEQFAGYRMVNSPERKSDTPRESLAHILHLQLVHLRAVKTGQLDFTPLDVGYYWQMSKSQLLAEMDRIDQEMFDCLTAETFNSAATIKAPWREVNAVDNLFFLRDHAILHVGWNLALMDHLNMPRLESLAAYWGAGDENSI